MADIQYKNVSEFPGWSKMPQFIYDFIQRNGIKTVIEIGAGANPTLTIDLIKKVGISYAINDLDIHELSKSSDAYIKTVFDPCSSNFYHANTYDLVFSRMALEHVSNAKTFHKNIFGILNPGGYAVHCFSTLYALPFVLNKFLPGPISNILLDIFNPRDRSRHEKFRAYYDWARGPNHILIGKFEALGYKVVNFTGYFGHPYYKKIPLLNKLEEIKSAWLVRHPISYLTSYGSIILQKVR